MNTRSLKYIILLFSFVFSLSVEAKGGGGAINIGNPGGRGDLMFFGLGFGHAKVTTPPDEMNPEFVGAVIGGVEIRLFNPVYFTLGVDAVPTVGKMKYDYTAGAVHYTASNISYNFSNTSLDAGLKIRLINAGNLHVFAGGGGLAGSADATYEVSSNATIVAAGSTYQKSQKGILVVGTYYEAGLDLMINHIGFRFAARMTNLATGKIEAMDNEKLKYSDSYGYIAFIKEM